MITEERKRYSLDQIGTMCEETINRYVQAPDPLIRTAIICEFETLNEEICELNLIQDYFIFQVTNLNSSSTVQKVQELIQKVALFATSKGLKEKADEQQTEQLFNPLFEFETEAALHLRMEAIKAPINEIHAQTPLGMSLKDFIYRAVELSWPHFQALEFLRKDQAFPFLQEVFHAFFERYHPEMSDVNFEMYEHFLIQFGPIEQCAWKVWRLLTLPGFISLKQEPKSMEGINQEKSYLVKFEGLKECKKRGYELIINGDKPQSLTIRIINDPKTIKYLAFSQEFNDVSKVVKHAKKANLCKNPLYIDENFKLALCKGDKKLALFKQKLGMWTISQFKELRNLYKAFKEHGQEHLLPLIQQLNPLQESTLPLCFSVSYFEAQGKRSIMQDAHTWGENETALMCGVFDGHGDQAAAKYAAKRFHELFPNFDPAHFNHMQRYFNQTLDQIHEEMRIAGVNGGTTVVVCLVDKRHNYVHTATLGDSEAKIYRYCNGKIISIPISCLRDWSHINDAARAAKALNQPYLATTWPLSSNPKNLRFPESSKGVNVSRSLGDFMWIRNGMEAISHKSKVTMFQLQPGDLLVLGCDGIWDFLKEEEFISNVLVPNWHGLEANLSQMIVNYAIDKCGGTDNATVVCVRV